MGSRSKARECALQALYQLDTAGGTTGDALAGLWAHFEPADADTTRFAEQLVRGVQNERAVIDELIQRTSTNWKIERMARVDRNIIRLAVYELLRRPEVPVKVTLNEAVELGKKYGSEESSAFVNGILDRIAHAPDLPQALPKEETGA
ncbi:MAG: transcription antitermination factor NusB [Myxococcales bacterium]